MDFKKQTENLLSELKKLKIDRRKIETDLNYGEFYIDQLLSKGGNRRFFNILKRYKEEILKKATLKDENHNPGVVENSIDQNISALHKLIDNNKTLVDTNRVIVDTNQTLVQNAVELTSMLKGVMNSTTGDDHQYMPEVLNATLRGFQELLAEALSGKKIHSKEEGMAYVDKKISDNIQEVVTKGSLAVAHK